MKRHNTWKKNRGATLMTAALLMLLCQCYGCATFSTATAGPNASAEKPQVEMALADSVAPRGPLVQDEPAPRTSTSHYRTYFTEPPGPRTSRKVVETRDSHPAAADGRTGLTNGEFLFIISPAIFAPYILGPATGVFIGIADVAGLVHTAATDLRDDVKSRRTYRTTQKNAFARSRPEGNSLDTAMSGSTFLK